MRVFKFISTIAKPVIIFFTILLVILTLATPSFAQLASDQYYESNTDRPGSDIRVFEVDPLPPNTFGGKEEICRGNCDREANCQSWTYVKPGVQGPKARCYLKKGIPQANSNNCCTSGVTTREVEFNTDRPGFDYKNLDLTLSGLVSLPGKGPNYNTCKSACENDSKCSAWTYSQRYRTKICWLKSKIPAANTNPNTISGVVSRPPVLN
jgi:hypothetical protein